MDKIIYTFIVGIVIGIGAAFAFSATGQSVAEVRARAERAEAELGRLTADYNKATEQLKFATDGVSQSAKRVGRVSDEIHARVERSISIVDEIRAINAEIQAQFIDCINNCDCSGRGSDNKIE